MPGSAKEISLFLYTSLEFFRFLASISHVQCRLILHKLILVDPRRGFWPIGTAGIN